MLVQPRAPETTVCGYREPVEKRPVSASEGIDSALDWTFFVIGGVAAVWLAYLLASESFTLGWWQIAFSVVFWVLMAYLVLPRLHRILTAIYVPDYFVGRARTSDGLLGDPINLVLMGSESQLHEMMTGAGWTLADDLSLATGWRIVRSTLLRRSYLEAPVSPLLLFGRKQDFAYQQEVDGSPGKRHHVRFWRCPAGWRLPGGRRVEWLAAGTFDRSVGVSLFTLQVTHKIAPDTDVERDHIVSTVTEANPVVAVTVMKDFTSGYHARNGGGDRIETDGDLPVLDARRVVGPIASRDDPQTDSRDKRPGATSLGALFVVVRAVTAASIAVGVLFEANAAIAVQLGSSTETSPVVATVVTWVVFGGAALVAVVDLLFAWRVFLGSNRARLIVMGVSTFSIVLQAVTAATGGPRITLATSLPSVSMDILLILALSSQRALDYARRETKRPKRDSHRPHATARV